MRKILYSSGFGAGWCTWGRLEQWDFAAEYAPIIEYLEADRPKKGPEWAALLERFEADMQAKWPGAHFYIGGADGLEVAIVNGPYRIEEYDGSERIVEAQDQEWH